MNNWRDVNVSENTIFSVLNRNFLSNPSTMPSFDSFTSVIVGSDYSGESKAEPYVVYSFLLAGHEAWAAWEKRRLQLRQQIMPDNRRMSYKKLGDRYRREFLGPILEIADELEGLSISLAISKAAPSLFPKGVPLDLSNPEFAAFRNWKGEVLEKAFNLLHFTGFILAGLARENQNVYWFTDQDEIAANPIMLEAFTKAFGWIANGYLEFDMGHFRCGTTSCDIGNQIEDFVCIPDLIAGAISEQFRASTSFGVQNNGVFWLTGAEMKDKAQSILFWYATRQKALKKHIIVIDPTDDLKAHKVSWFNFTNQSTHVA